MGQGRGDQHLGLGKSRTQANNLVQGLQSGIEFSRVKLDHPGPDGPKPSQRIVRAGAHRLPQPIERFFAISAKPQDTTEHADHERAVWIEQGTTRPASTSAIPSSMASLSARNFLA